MESKEFVISGEIAGVPDGAKVELKEIKDNNPVLLDSTTLKDGKFTLKGSVTEPDIHILTIQKVPGRLPFILENKKLNMALYKDSLGLSKIAGSKENDVAQNYMKAVTKFRKKNDALMIDLNQARQKNDTLFLKGFRDKRQEIKNENDAFNLEFLKENNKSLFAALLLENLLRTNTLKIEEANEYFKAFPEKLQQTSVGIRIKERIDASMATEIGSVAPDFTAPNPEGKEISLNEIKGKVTIIDFWAAWCGPCRKENPNLVNLYNNYHDKGLEIIGVSLDGNTRQKDAKQEWLDAIEKDGLTWYQVSNLNYFNDPVAKKYNIQAIPATFILDSEGKIIDKNLRGPVLEQKISELLD
jgi:peroxiredoxin